MEDTAPLCLSFPTCKTGAWWGALTCIPAEGWRRGRCSKPGRVFALLPPEESSLSTEHGTGTSQVQFL